MVIIMNIIKKILPICIVFFLIIFAICIFGLNDIQLKIYELQLKAQKLPENTEFIEMQSVLGKLNGTGNGINFLNTMLIHSDLTLDELENYYTDMGLDVIKQTNCKFIHKLLEHGAEIEYDSLVDKTLIENYYVVIQYKSGNAWNDFDIRGH